MKDDSIRSGVLVVDKGRGATSFDVVALVRRRLGVRRIGHAGTLDPDATGVLPILVGEATKLTPYLVDQDKEYLATIRFGLTTDTHDVSGRVLSESPVEELSVSRLEVVRAPREVIVQSIQVEALAGAQASVRVVCGKGTYVRVLAADIGAALGCGGAIESLVRCRVGPFLLGVGELISGGRSVRPVRILHADRPGTRVLPA